MDHDAKLDRASILNAGGAAALAALFSAAGCSSGKSGNGSSSQNNDGAQPSPQGTESTHPIHMCAVFNLNGTKPGTFPGTPTTCTIVICDDATPLPSLPNGAVPILTMSKIPARTDDTSCDLKNATSWTQSVLIYFT